MRVKVLGGALVSLALILLPAASASASSGGGFAHTSEHSGGTGPQAAVVALESSPYGQVLVVGGKGAGFYPAGSSLYSPTIDPPALGASAHYVAGCNATTQAVSIIEGGPDTCTGADTDQAADWPAFTTNGPPVAGQGVNPALLGSVYRSDLQASQVTYAGHPLYLFDPGPDSFAGQDFFETVGPFLFPWQTAWYLVSPDGGFNAGPAHLSVLTPQPGSDYTSNVVGTEMLPNIGLPHGVPVAVYTFSADGRSQSQCYGACAREFIPLTTVGSPTEHFVKSSAISSFLRSDGLRQVTYYGHPLYIFNQEQPLPLGKNRVKSVGNGNGVSGFGGTLNLVTP